MLLRKQNSGTVYATRSSGGKSLRTSPSNLLVVPTRRLLLSEEAAHEKRMGASRRRRTILHQRKTPTLHCPAYERWKPAVALCTADPLGCSGSDNGLHGREQRSRRIQ